jgi:hypothetical protein
MSRQREYLADASAVQFTRYPDGLVQAFEVLENGGKSTKMENPSSPSVIATIAFLWFFPAAKALIPCSGIRYKLGVGTLAAKACSATIFQLNMWRSVLYVEETGVPGENDRPVANH